jgi:hypothetical protein
MEVIVVLCFDVDEEGAEREFGGADKKTKIAIQQTVSHIIEGHIKDNKCIRLSKSGLGERLTDDNNDRFAIDGDLRIL